MVKSKNQATGTKKIYINGRFLTQPITGVQRSAVEFVKSLNNYLTNNPTINQEFEIICLVPGSFRGDLGVSWQNIKIQKTGKLSGNLWEQIELPIFARNGLLICLCNIGPIMHFNQIVVFHDASVFAVPDAYSISFKIKYWLIMWVLSLTSRSILTDSEFSKNEIIKYLRVKEEKIIVNYLGCEHILDSIPDYSILNANGIKEKKYILTVGSSSPHKNVISLVNAFLEIDKGVDLVVVGGQFSKVFHQVEDFQDAESIIRLGYVSDNELRALYEKAICFAFPSYYEGFGFPPLEAMTCGCPVISSNSASLPEVCGDAALFFNPMDVEEIKQSMEKMIANSSLQEELRRKGYEQAKKFTWDIAAKRLMEVLLNFSNYS